MAYFANDDIAQISTPPGNALLGVVRISGPNAFGILGKTTQGLEPQLAAKPKRAIADCRFALSLKTFQNPFGERATFHCPARVLLMPGPASYTTENVAEVQLPGAPPILNAALRALVQAGARPAEPGEFTFRAFRGGRLSLRQAEAVEEVIRAESDAEKRQALARLGGATKSGVARWRDQLLDCSARVEAALDFSEEELEGDVATDIAQIAQQLDAAAGSIAAAGGGIDSGLPEVALVGLANAGKSSLLNALLEKDDVIVSPAASTTRDAILREVAWHGARFMLSDNPGFDPGREGAGGMAAERAFRRLGGHDLAAWIVDTASPVNEETERFAKSLSGGIVLVLNKTDLPERTTAREMRQLADDAGLAVLATVPVSAKTGAGMGELRAVLARHAAALRVAGPWNRREAWELAAARECCRDALAELGGPGRIELAAEDLRRGVLAFGRALGEGYGEEMLTRIFSRFCIGK